MINNIKKKAEELLSKYNLFIQKIVSSKSSINEIEMINNKNFYEEIPAEYNIYLNKSEIPLSIELELEDFEDEIYDEYNIKLNFIY